MIQKLDLEPLKFSPYVNNNQGYITKFGGVKMILVLILILLSIIAFGKELFLKENPIVISSENYISLPLINKERLSIAIAPMLLGGFKIENAEKYFEFNFNLADTDGSRPENSQKTIFTSVKMVKCEESQLFKENTFNITSKLISIPSTYLCIDKLNSNIIDIEGSYGNPKFKMWVISLDYCKNTTENNSHCKSRDEIQRYLPVFYAHIIISDYYIDSKNFNKPLQETYSTKLLRVSTKNSRKDIFFYRTFKYFSDSGIILENKSLTTGFYFHKFETDCLFDPNTTELLRLTLSIDNIESIFERSYVKFQKVAADIGGFLKFITVILTFISHKYSIVHFYNYLSNYFITQKKEENISKHIQKSNQLNQLKTKINNFVNEKTSSRVVIKLNHHLNHDDNSKISKRPIGISLLIGIKFYFCCKFFHNSDIKRLIFIGNYFKNKFSIESLLNVINEVEISKKIKFKENVNEYNQLLNRMIHFKINDSQENCLVFYERIKDLYKISESKEE